MNSARFGGQVQDLLTACRVLLHQGLTEAFGHVSIRQGEQMLITPRDPISAARAPQDLVEVDLDADPIVLGPRVPPEAFLHIGIYRARPDVNAVLDAILPHYIAFQLFQMALNARASEHSARMVAMKNATDNAKELIKDLTLEYNKVRQANITTELLEITTAQLAVG